MEHIKKGGALYCTPSWNSLATKRMSSAVFVSKWWLPLTSFDSHLSNNPPFFREWQWCSRSVWTSNDEGPKADRNCIRECLCGFARWLPVKQNNSASVYNTVDHALGRATERKKALHFKDWGIKTSDKSSFFKLSGWRHSFLTHWGKKNGFCFNIVLKERKTKHYSSKNSDIKSWLLLNKKKTGCMVVHVKQLETLMRTENTESIVIRGWKTKASSGGCRIGIRAAAT